MFSLVKPHFPHRLNIDGSHDSICTLCLATVASGRYEPELLAFEQDHSCDPIRLFQLGRHPQSTSDAPVPLH